MKEEISIQICDEWISRGFFKETNKNCSPLVAFDWIEDEHKSYLVDFNTNIDLKDNIVDTFLFNNFIDFLLTNNYKNVLGLRNTGYLSNPSKKWTSKLKDSLENNNIEYDEFLVNRWPEPMPKFEVDFELFMLRYSFDEYSPIDKFASSNQMFENFISRTNYSENFKSNQNTDLSDYQKYRVIVLINNCGNIILHNQYEFNRQ